MISVKVGFKLFIWLFEMHPSSAIAINVVALSRTSRALLKKHYEYVTIQGARSSFGRFVCTVFHQSNYPRYTFPVYVSLTEPRYSIAMIAIHAFIFV